jgi:hypothetical protein
VHITKRKEEFRLAYARAIASVAGFGTSVPVPDNESIDLVLYKKSDDDEEDEGGTPITPRIEIQLKCTARNVIRDDAVHLPLKIKNYNELENQE